MRNGHSNMIVIRVWFRGCVMKTLMVAVETHSTRCVNIRIGIERFIHIVVDVDFDVAIGEIRRMSVVVARVMVMIGTVLVQTGIVRGVVCVHIGREGSFPRVLREGWYRSGDG